jgi:GNAT superfamily N-acetyltransferase
VTEGEVDRIRIGWYDEPRALLRPLYELADDSSDEIDAYIELGRVLVARGEQGDIIGHLQLIADGTTRTADLKSIAVRPDWQGRGVGRRLVDRAISICRDDGLRALTVTTAVADLENLRFYQRCGFRATSIQRDAFTEAKGYPPELRADGIPVRDSITFTLALDCRASGD